MKIFFPFMIVTLLFFGCSKDDTSVDFTWSKSFGTGEAKSVNLLNDSLLIACGQVNGNPFLVSLNNDHEVSALINPDIEGLFSSFYADTSGFIAAGCRGTDLLLMHHDFDGYLIWEDTIKTGFNVESARVLTIGNGLLAIATPDPDSLDNGDSGFMFVKFDASGTIVKKKKVTFPGRFASVSDAVTDSEGNIYLALTYRTPGSRSYSSMAAYSADLVLLWETTMFNNRAFSSASLAVGIDGTKVFAGGRTEISNQEGPMVNSFLVALNKNNGNISEEWPQKRYLELRNEGASIIMDNSNTLYYLNKSCFIINKISPSDGSDKGLIRPFNLCVSESTDAFASDFSLINDNSFVIAGSLGGNFFIGIKEVQ